ncbi:MAG: OmpA family protein, partial [Chitinophagaceae bacterium]
IRLRLVDSIVIEGHTDNKGTVPLNEKLSQNRAISVAGQLAHSDAEKKLSFYTRGWAAQKPRSSNSTPAGRQKNRRVEIFIYKQD